MIFWWRYQGTYIASYSCFLYKKVEEASAIIYYSRKLWNHSQSKQVYPAVADIRRRPRCRVQTIMLLTYDYWCLLFNYFEHVRKMLHEEFMQNQSDKEYDSYTNCY